MHHHHHHHDHNMYAVHGLISFDKSLKRHPKSHLKSHLANRASTYVFWAEGGVCTGSADEWWWCVSVVMEGCFAGCEGFVPLPVA
mmetsp:Transcript_18472/g.35978  ORF Transcript_18472/g.35978 Transcript_18472/m.35978 type:complete len:85 (-) Transcript_18472:79-333(-)